MKTKRLSIRSLFTPHIFSLLLLLLISSTAAAQQATSRKYMAATVNPLATQAALDALQKGGNAVDAAVAAALTLGVVDGHNSGIGGGCFILLRLADGSLIAIDGRETAPADASEKMYLRDGKPDGQLSKTGALASGVPGALAAYQFAVERHGQLSLKELLLPAAEIAEQGFPLDRIYARNLNTHTETIKKYQSTNDVLLKKDGTAYREGETLKLPDLANTYRAIAREGTDWFYRGPFAQETQKWMGKNGGIMTAKDFADYRPKIREPIISRYRGYTIVGFPPPSSGGIHVAQILNILEHFDLQATYQQSQTDFYHLLAEAMRPAFADRAHWLGDADFAKVPRGLIDRKYATELAQKIDLKKTANINQHGDPPRWNEDVFGKHTTHIATADSAGNWVAITATVNTSFGSKVIIPGTGVVMNNQMDDFSIHPGVPNAFGLIGAKANAIEPGKRPLSSMSPTIILKQGRPIMTVGAAGGPKIITQTLLMIVRRIDLDMPLSEAVAAPRIHHQWSPDILFVEKGFPTEIIQQLEKRGHSVQETSHAGVTQSIMQWSQGGPFIGVHDPRVPGKAAGQ